MTPHPRRPPNSPEPLRRRPSSTAPARSSIVVFALAVVLATGAQLAVPDAAHGQDEPPLLPPPATGGDDVSLLNELEGLLWLDRSSALLALGATAVTTLPGSPPTLLAGGRGFIVRSRDDGLTWQPVLLLHGAELGETSSELDDPSLDLVDPEPLFLRLDENDLDRFEDADLLERFEELREELLDELTEQYGEDLAEELVSELESELREEALSEFLSDLGADPYDDTLDDALDDGPTRAGLSERATRLMELGLDDETLVAFLDDPLVVHQLFAPPTAPDTVYAATGRGLFRTTDSGRTWQRLLRGTVPGEPGVISVAASPDGRRILAGGPTGMLVSDDAGRTWNAPVGDLAQNPILQITGGLNDGSRFLALTPQSLERTEDGGLTWQTLSPTEFDPDEVRRLVPVLGWSDTFFAATRRGAFRSDDGGVTWSDLASDTLIERELVDLVLPEPGDPDGLLALGERRVMVSLDGGETWVDVSSGLVGQELVAGTSGGSAATLWLATRSGLVRGLLGVEATLEAETVRQLRELWTDEPSPAQVIDAALVYAGLDDIPTDAWLARNFTARFLPTVQGELFWRTTRYDREYVDFELESLDVVPSLDTLTRQRRIAEPRTFFDWQIMALWDLGGLVFDDNEVTIERTGQTLAQARRQLLVRLVRLYLARRALQLRVTAEQNADLERRLEATLQLEESTALLDALTGGFFTASSAARAARRRNSP